MANLLYSLPADNIAALVMPTVATGTPDTDYPVANLVDLSPALPCKLAGHTGAFLWSFAEAKRLDIVAIIHHNLDAGLSVKIQGHTSNDFAAPTLSQAITIPAYWEDGMPVNPFVDLTSIGSRSFQYWRLLIDGTNTAHIAIGDVMLVQTKRLMPINIEWGLIESEERPIIEHVTDYMVPSIYSYNVSKRQVKGTLDTSDAGAVSLNTWWRSCFGRALPFLFALDSAVNDCMLARFQNTKLEITREFLDINKANLEFEEVARGLAL